MTERLHFHFSLSCIGEGNGNLLQCSCLENPRDRGAQQVAVYGVAQSQTRLKGLSSSSSSSTILPLSKWCQLSQCPLQLRSSSQELTKGQACHLVIISCQSLNISSVSFFFHDINILKTSGQLFCIIPLGVPFAFPQDEIYSEIWKGRLSLTVHEWNVITNTPQFIFFFL